MAEPGTHGTPGTPGAPRSEAGPAAVEPAGPRGASPVEVLAAGPGRYGPESGFDAVVRPLSVQEFLDTRYRDKRPVLFRGPGPRFASLCTWDDLNEMLSSGAWQGRMRLFQDGRQIAEPYYTAPNFGLGWRVRGGPIAERQIDDRRLTAYLHKGATIVLSRIQDVHPTIRPLADALEAILEGYATINLYASWMATRGFATHWDDHDVFVLQVAGRKRWQIYGEMRRFPLTTDSEPNEKAPRKAVWSEVLEAGDVLYIPRGWWHDARVEPGDASGSTGSLHLSCNAPASTGFDFIEWLAGRLSRHEAFRRDLPHSTDEAGGAHFAALRELVNEELQGDVGRRFRDHLRSAWSERPRPSLGPSIEPWKSPDWERYGVRLRGASRAVMERTGEGDVVLEANGYRWTFDGRCTALTALLLRDEVVRVGAFREALPEGAPASLAEEFVRLLVERGIAHTIPPAAACDRPAASGGPAASGTKHRADT